jgi:hypothetical protein
VAIAPSRLTARRGKRFRVPYAATDSAQATVDVLDRRGKRVAHKAGASKAGRNTIAATVRRTGRFTLRLTLERDGATTSDRITLTVKRH